FPRAYEQCYFLYLSLHQPNRDLEHSGNYAYEVFPWQGGYSAVDFYNRLKWAVSKRRRPRITRIEYASPGVIELGGLVVAVAVLIEKVVHSICRVPHFSRLSREVGLLENAFSKATCGKFLSSPHFASIPAKPLIATQI